MKIPHLDGKTIFEDDAKTTKKTLENAVKNDANLCGANLCGANLFAANLSDANLFAANLFAANLSAAKLSAAKLSAANLCGANLCGANLSAANLYAANLSDANLSAANLSAANLSAANLYDANLSDANLFAANLSAAKLSAAKLSAAGFKNNNFLSLEINGMYKYHSRSHKNPSDGKLLVRLGCFDRTIAEWDADFNNNPTEFPEGSPQWKLRKQVYNIHQAWLIENFGEK